MRLHRVERLGGGYFGGACRGAVGAPDRAVRVVVEPSAAQLQPRDGLRLNRAFGQDGFDLPRAGLGAVGEVETVALVETEWMRERGEVQLVADGDKVSRLAVVGAAGDVGEAEGAGGGAVAAPKFV